MKWIITITLYLHCIQIQGQQSVLADSMPVAGKWQVSIYKKSNIIESNINGTVYALPQDGMPALKPDTTINYQMPIAGLKKIPFQNSFVGPNLKTNPQQYLPPQWKDSVIQTPNGPQIIQIPIIPEKFRRL